MTETERILPREERVREILNGCGVFLTDGHFVFTSGLHGDTYVNKDRLYPHTKATREICAMWAEDFKDQEIEVVVAPEKGGIVLSHITASELTTITGIEVLAAYAEKTPEGEFEFRRGYGELIRGKRVLVVEDNMTTGGSGKKVVDLVRETGGVVVAVGIIVNRGEVRPEDVGVEILDSLLSIPMQAVKPEDCVKCADGVPINNKVGAGKSLGNQPTTF